MIDKRELTATIGLSFILSASAQKPNIIYIFTDQQTANAMSCAGNNDVKTPNIDRLAQQGVRFTNAYCAAPLSTPSRASMFTGLTPGEIGMMVNGSKLPKEIKTLGSVFEQAGYDCAYAGKWHLPDSDIPDKEFGFTKIHPHNDYGLAEACVSFLTESRDKPFFLVASFDNPHNICEYARGQNLPFASVVEPDIKDCPALPANFAINPYDADVVANERQSQFRIYCTTAYTADDWRRYRNAYYRLVENVDREIGKILQCVENGKLRNNTIVIFSSDHGDGNASHQWNQKSALYEEVVNIPFIVRMPDMKYAGTIKTQLVNNGIDLMPTLCDLAYITIPAHCNGKSLKAVLSKNDNLPIRDFLVIETQFDNSTTKGWAVRTANFKYILYDKGRNREQLYDINADKGELVNLAINSRYQDEVVKHRKILLSWMKSVKTPEKIINSVISVK